MPCKCWAHAKLPKWHGWPFRPSIPASLATETPPAAADGAAATEVSLAGRFYGRRDYEDVEDREAEKGNV